MTSMRHPSPEQLANQLGADERRVLRIGDVRAGVDGDIKKCTRNRIRDKDNKDKRVIFA